MCGYAPCLTARMTNPTRPPHAFLKNKTAVSGRCLALVLGLAAAVSGRAATAENAGGAVPLTAAERLGDDDLIIEEVFSSHLPTTLKKYGFRLSVHPHLGDWQKKDHMRMTTSLRYGLTEKCEISAGSNLYFSHGHGEIRAFEDNGAASLRLGAKLDLGQLLFAGWETGVGVSYEFPTGHPAPELTDGLRHLRPYITFSHRLGSRPEWRIFVGARYDRVTTTSLPGEFAKNSFRESSAGITGGFVVDRGNLHYTFEATADTNRLGGGGSEEIYSVRPGVLWEIPRRHDRRLRSNWMVGAALNSTHGPGGNSLGASFKLRYSRDLKVRRSAGPAAATP